MSEENEHTSEETDTEMNAGNHTNEQSKSGASILNNETEEPMLEDEEMPTYISVSSPSRREDANVNNTKQHNTIPMEEDHSRSPYPSDDQGGGSIYVLSSGEESNHPYNDDDDDDYGDSDDMDEMELENDHRNVMLEDEEDEEEEEEEDDENPLRLYNDDDEDANTEYDQECFDRASDDFILNNRLKQHHKERSLSLQDLSFSKTNVLYNKKRFSLNSSRQNYLNLHHNPITYPVVHKKQTMPPKYQHVESKVKRYIKDIKEQNRKSMEKRMKEQEYVTIKKHRENENNDIDPLKPAVINKVIKDYAEKAIKDLQREENENNKDDNSVRNTAQIVENGDNIKIDIRILGNQATHIQKDTEINKCGSVHNETRAQNCDDKLTKQNGSIDIKVHHMEYQNTPDQNVKLNSTDQPSLVNGHQAAPTLLNLRTLSYEEYMHGSSNTGQNRIQEKANEPEVYNEVEMMTVQEMGNSNTSCPLKIENVKSIRTTQDVSENLSIAKVSKIEGTNAENIEIIQLKAQFKAQLSQRDAQFNNLQNVYHKTLAENIKMKQELDALKKSLANYESKDRACKTKIAAVQTETVVEPTIVPKVTVTTGETSNKISSSSVASTISSIDHWAESAGSPAVSIKPPDLTPILNSDDSMVLTDGTPRKLENPLSRAFLTSSRILQTLSNIAQGKTRVESPLVKNSKKRTNENSTDQLLNLNCNSPIHASSSKKRKATDMLGTSAIIQPHKIPHTTIESEKTCNSDTINTEFKYPEVHTSIKIDQQQNKSVNKNVDNSTFKENQEENNDKDESVKCFVYREDNNSIKRSFLIQAEDPLKDKSGTENHIQECGPYLLGNLEIRMSEINGTISVWGKEIGEKITNDSEDDMGVCMKSIENKTCSCWQKTPHSRFNGSPLACSTSSKQIPLKFNRSNVSQCCHYLTPNSVKSSSLVNDASDKRHAGNAFSLSTYNPSGEECDSAKHRKEWPTCKNISNLQDKLHSCNIHPTERADKECSCGSYHETRTHDDNPTPSKDKYHVKGNRRNSYKSMPSPGSNGHLHENVMNTSAEVSEIICKYNKTYRNPQNMADNIPHSSKCCSVHKDTSYMHKTSSNNMHNHDCSERQTYNRSPSNEGEDDLLIPAKRSNETAETRQRRLSGKRVRGILMDLLRGCGDCRSTGTNGASKSNLQHNGPSCVTNVPPQIKISRCPTPEPSCSNTTQCNERCCHAYARRIESQLEEFRMEMERVRSRSDAILDMLNMLHSVDMN
ncbi:kinesin-related protein 4-like [Colletes gigas]|uniref:kinesin-related protein 4-like n=1 Tax=Colletes gigas TaxID=935657 RepID=UPI001C9A331A|nr:kinesin-related protein 4-like [Colletes gigas]XP_043248487.1 kinesin-related protein 4-like [Colletes gigas]XP_043248488.1 kinesin-related protein 4-like [Colletes gigas]